MIEGGQMNKTKLKKLFKKTVPKVLLICAALFLLCLIYCKKLVFNMETLHYKSWGLGVVLVEYKFDFVRDSVDVYYYDFDGTIISHKEDQFSKEQQREVKVVCAAAYMPLWRSSYINSRVDDGDQWDITADYGSMEKSVYGSNAYPRTYRSVYEKIRSIADGIGTEHGSL